MAIIKLATITEDDQDVQVLDPTENQSKLVLYNDDHNSFDWVIECLVKVCKHTPAQAEQCSYIVHFKGKATVKSGSHEELKPMKDALVDRGLSAVIEN